METHTRKFRVGISGSYGGLNLGDEAILQALVTELRQSLPVEITVFSRDPVDTLARHAVEHAVPVRELTRAEVLPEIEPLDLLILGGGGILFDAEVNTYLREVSLAQEIGVPVMIYAVSAGPLQDQTAQALVRDCLNRAAAVTVRERNAQKVLEAVGVQQDIVVTADPAFLLQPQPLPPDTLQREGIDDSHLLVGISVREPGVAAPDIDEQHYHALLANAADYMIERLDADLVFVPMERLQRDTQHCHSVIAQMAYAHRATVLKGKYTSGQILSLVGHFTFVLGMRLHFLIFAALQRVPAVALSYAGKVTGCLEALELPISPLHEVNAGQLMAHIDRSWDFRHDIQVRLEHALPDLQERARTTNRIAVQLLTETAAGQAPGKPKFVV